MRIEEAYKAWLDYPLHPEGLHQELVELGGNEAERTERFYRDLEFGTGGMRGILGAGTNRMNIYTVRKATLGLASYLGKRGGAVVIGYDCRRMSAEFALDTGLVLAAQGIRAFVFEHLCPTPELSYAVRELQADAGIMITASHNPPEYNGYKLYGKDGGQILPDVAAAITAEIAAITDVFQIPLLKREQAEESGLLQWVGARLDEQYSNRVVQEIRSSAVTDSERAALRVVYSPLHGTGHLPVRTTLQQAGYTGLVLVASQTEPDGEFPTVKSPNPEEPAAFTVALETARQVQADLVMATDPDADRVGVAVRNRLGEYELLTGNQTGGLLLDFLLNQKQQAGLLPHNAIVFKTIVTSDLGAAVAEQHGVAVEDTLTGFKYIGDRIAHYEATAEKTFLFGYEESYGYLLSPIVRDKDAVQSCLAIAEMAAHYKSAGKTLLEALQDLFTRVGYFREELLSVTLPGAQGLETIQAIMHSLRTAGPTLAKLPIQTIEDYQTSTRAWYPEERQEALSLPISDVLKYGLENGSWLAVRPSGTEPKIKFYLGAKGRDDADCERQLQDLRRAVDGVLKLDRGHV